jgi:hypothetical protein
VTTVFVDRLIGLLSMLLFACLMMIPNLSLLSDHGLLRTVSVFIVCMMLGGGLVAGLSFWGGLSRTLPQARAWLRKLPKGDCWNGPSIRVAALAARWDFSSGRWCCRWF